MLMVEVDEKFYEATEKCNGKAPGIMMMIEKRKKGKRQTDRQTDKTAVNSCYNM